MTQHEKTLRHAAARWIEAKRKLEEKDHTDAELAKLIPPYRRATLGLLEACTPIGEAELAAEKQAKAQENAA